MGDEFHLEKTFVTAAKITESFFFFSQIKLEFGIQLVWIYGFNFHEVLE